MKKANILFVMIEGGGNVPPMFGLAKRLINHGHSITILSEPCLEEPIKELGAIFIPFKKHFTRTDRKTDLFKDWNASKINNPIFKRVMFGPAPYIIDHCEEAIRSNYIDILVVDVLLFPAIIAAEYLNIPKAIVFHMPEFLPGSNRPPGNMGLHPGKGLFYRLRDKILGKLMISKFDEFKSLLNEKLAALSLSPLKHTIDLFDRADLRLIQTLQSFDIPIDPSPSNVRYVGPELGDPDWASNEDWTNPWSDQDKKPMIVISFSSTFQNQGLAIQNCIDAVSDLPVNACVTLGPAMEDQDFSVPKNVLVFNSVKHSVLFPHANLVITHGGHGTLMRALANGLPIICLPMGRDQDDNAIKVELKGCGISLSPKSSASKIRKAIERVLANEKYKVNAQKMKDEINSNASRGAAVTEINNLIVGDKAVVSNY